ncbi:hypothetical protein [Helicobacter heilmannii]|uniref:hypothetical protein n=1 Tax=Helicobacter heilmannii TaxID=35817 RepID=UPI000CF0516E|nr:hypothetical protein [Helicobacter heilmannii]
MPLRSATLLKRRPAKIGDLLDGVQCQNIAKRRKSIRKDFFGALQNKVGDANLDPDAISSSVQGVIANINLPEFSYDSSLPSELNKSGQLGWQGQEFLQAAEAYADNLKDRVKGDVRQIVQALEGTLKGAGVSNKLMDSYEQEITSLQKEVQNKEQSLQTYQELIAALKAL